MSATLEKLLTISYVTDHDCGNYRIGEIDFGIHGTLRKYLMDYGNEGKQDIIKALAYLIYNVESEFRSIDSIEQWAAQDQSHDITTRSATRAVGRNGGE